MKKLLFVFILCFSIPSLQASFDPETIRNQHVSHIKSQAQCKLSPSTRIILSMPQDRDFYKKIIIDDEEILRLQCKKWIPIHIYLENNGNIFRVSAEIENNFPQCLNTIIHPGESRKQFIQYEYLAWGNFIHKPLVLDTEYNVLLSNFTLSWKTDTNLFPHSSNNPSEILQMERASKNRYSPYNVDINVSYLPECTPNIKTSQ